MRSTEREDVTWDVAVISKAIMPSVARRQEKPQKAGAADEDDGEEEDPLVGPDAGMLSPHRNLCWRAGHRA
eukprot:49040-Rhodomonas_salina.4